MVVVVEALDKSALFINPVSSLGAPSQLSHHAVAVPVCLDLPLGQPDTIKPTTPPTISTGGVCQDVDNDCRRPGLLQDADPTLLNRFSPSVPSGLGKEGNHSTIKKGIELQR